MFCYQFWSARQNEKGEWEPQVPLAGPIITTTERNYEGPFIRSELERNERIAKGERFFILSGTFALEEAK